LSAAVAAKHGLAAGLFGLGSNQLDSEQFRISPRT
jgi:hypothetical protein